MTTSAAQLPTDMAVQLDQLRDIRLPPDIAWWPLAPGWWALALTFVGLAAVAGFVLLRRRKSLRYRALAELLVLKNDAALKQQPLRLAEHVGTLLKRILLQQPQHQSLAASSGDSWSNFLIEEPGAMDNAVAKFVASAPYRHELPAHMQDLPDEAIPPVAKVLEAAENWIRRNA